ncbi:MAG TPA: hypothetical protein VE693_10040 [Gaiellaceae bacterium]|nr:hypothetical protein [Gaiellaceae bacterium]
MVRRVGGQPSRCLLELAFAGDSAAGDMGVVPRHGDMYEALEEVALLRFGRPPDVFEDLVGGEILAGLDQ